MDVRERYKIGGRPVKFKSPQDMIDKIYAFLEMTAGRKKEIVTKNGNVVEISCPAPTTIEDFCTFAGITKTTFYEYRNKKAFKPIVEQYHQIVEAYWVRLCAEGPAGNKADFVLKNGFAKDWQDRNVRELDFAEGVKEALVSFVGEDDGGKV